MANSVTYWLMLNGIPIPGEVPAAGPSAKKAAARAPAGAAAAVEEIPATPRVDKYSKRTTIKDVQTYYERWIDQDVTVMGWVRTIRSQKGRAFIAINDGSCVANMQIVAESAATEGFDQASEQVAGASMKVVGKLVRSPAAGQPCEIQAKSLVVLGSSHGMDYPLAKKKHPLEFLRENAHLRSRTNVTGAMIRIRNALAFATHQFFQSNGFINLHTPLITASDCEGAGEMFRVTTLPLEDLPKTKSGAVDYSKDFFKAPAMLTVSGQLNAETYAVGLSKVYTFGPTFRAENSHTTRHLAEFWMIEPETAFADIFDNMNLAEDYLKACLRHVLASNPEDLAYLEGEFAPGLVEMLSGVAFSNFTRITYTEGVEILIKSGQTFERKVEWGMDLGAEHERYLAEKVFNGPVIVRDYPKDIKAFYMRQNEDGRTVAAMDVLLPRVGELMGGSQREERLDRLEARIKEIGLPIENYSWYLDLRRFGSVPHAGFGLGFERLVMYCTGMENIRDVIPFPRYPGNAAF